MSKSARNRTQRAGAPQGKAGSGKAGKAGAGGKNAKRKPNALTKKTPPWGAIAFFTTIGIIVAGAITYAVMQGSPPSGEAAMDGLIQKKELGRDHTKDAVKYDTTPPVGGNHDPVWQNCDGRVYDKPLRNENAVHALEHGAVWITYKPDLPADQVNALKSKVQGVDYTLLSPYPGLDQPIALSAWGRQVKVPNASDSRVDKFLKTYVKGPQTPEPGAACTGGKDTP